MKTPSLTTPPVPKYKYLRFKNCFGGKPVRYRHANQIRLHLLTHSFGQSNVTSAEPHFPGSTPSNHHFVQQLSHSIAHQQHPILSLLRCISTLQSRCWQGQVYAARVRLVTPTARWGGRRPYVFHPPCTRIHTLRPNETFSALQTPHHLQLLPNLHSD